MQPSEVEAEYSEEPDSALAETGTGPPLGPDSAQAGVEPEGQGPSEETRPPGLIVSLEDNRLEPGENPARLDINCSEMQAEVFERFAAKLRVGMELAELTLVSAGEDTFTYVFSPDENGWLEGETGTLEIIDPLGEVKAYRTVVTVATSEPLEGEISSSALANNGNWDVLDAKVISSFSGQQLVVEIIPPNLGASAEAVNCTFTVLPTEAGIEDLFEGLSLKGEFILSSQPDGSVVGMAGGMFVEGDLIVKLTNSAGASWLATLPLAAPKIGASLVLPAVNTIIHDRDTGMVEPAWLRWECRFNGIKPLEPEALSLKSSIELQGAEVLKVLFSDNGIALEIELSGLAGQLADHSEIDFWVDSSTDIQWDKSSKKTIAVLDASAAQATTMLTVQEKPVVITPRGFEVKYKLSSELEHSELSGAIKASSGMLLLDWNLSGFNIQTEILSLSSGSILIVKFIRDPIRLDEAAYSDFAKELVGAGKVGLKLLWIESGVRDSCQIQFSQ